MTRFIIRRLLQAIPTFFGITFIVYMIVVMAPGDPVEIMSFGPNTSVEEKEALASRLGISDPLPIQYLRWLIGDDWKVVDEVLWYQIRLEDGTEGWLAESMIDVNEETGESRLTASRQPYRDLPSENAEIVGRVGRRDVMELVTSQVEQVRGDNKGILRGDFGRSFQQRRNPLIMLTERLPATLELNIAVVFLSLILGVTIGVLAAVWRGGWFDTATRVLAVIGDAIPSFWLGLLLILLFAIPDFGFSILPINGRCAPTRDVCPPIYERLEYMILPALVLVLGGIAGWSRYIRAAMLENISSDYVRTAKAKGLPSRAVWFHHSLRNALIPMATFLGPTFVAILGSSIIIEKVFAWPGAGLLTLQAILSQDYPVVMAAVVIGAILTIIGYLISDILYALFDPRIRL